MGSIGSVEAFSRGITPIANLSKCPGGDNKLRYESGLVIGLISASRQSPVVRGLGKHAGAEF